MAWPDPIATLAVTNLSRGRLEIAVEDYLTIACRDWPVPTVDGVSILPPHIFESMVGPAPHWERWNPAPTVDDILDDQDADIESITVCTTLHRKSPLEWLIYSLPYSSTAEDWSLAHLRIFPSDTPTCKVLIYVASFLTAGQFHDLATYLVNRYPDRIREWAGGEAAADPDGDDEAAPSRRLEASDRWPAIVEMVKQYEARLDQGQTQEAAARKVKGPEGNPIPRKTLEDWRKRVHRLESQAGD